MSGEQQSTKQGGTLGDKAVLAMKDFGSNECEEQAHRDVENNVYGVIAHWLHFMCEKIEPAENISDFIYALCNICAEAFCTKRWVHLTGMKARLTAGNFCGSHCYRWACPRNHEQTCPGSDSLHARL